MNREQSYIENSKRQDDQIRCNLLAIAVTDYDPQRNCVDVKIAHKFRQMAQSNRDVDDLEFQILKDVPVARINNVQFIFKSGQPGWVWFNDMDSQNYIENNDPNMALESSRTHHYSDAVFVPARIAKNDNNYSVVVDDVNQTTKFYDADGNLAIEILPNQIKMHSEVQFLAGTIPPI